MAKKDYDVKKGTKTASVPAPAPDDFGIVSAGASSSGELKSAASNYSELMNRLDDLKKKANDALEEADRKKAEVAKLKEELEAIIARGDKLKKAYISAESDVDQTSRRAGELLKEVDKTEREAEKAYNLLVEAVEASRKKEKEESLPYIWPVKSPEGGLTPSERQQLEELLRKLK